MNRVALVGSSVALASIGAALANMADLSLLSFELPSADAAMRVAAFEPDVVIFDLADDIQHSLLTTLSGRSDLALIGFDLNTQKMLLLSGEQASLSTTEDLVQAVKKLAKANPALPGIDSTRSSSPSTPPTLADCRLPGPGK